MNLRVLEGISYAGHSERGYLFGPVWKGIEPTHEGCCGQHCSRINQAVQGSSEVAFPECQDPPLS